MKYVWLEDNPNALIPTVIRDAAFNKIKDSAGGITSFYLDRARDFATLKSIENSRFADLIGGIIEENASRSEQM